MDAQKDSGMTIKHLADDTIVEFAEMKVQLKRAGEVREKKNKQLPKTIADQRTTRKLLQGCAWCRFTLSSTPTSSRVTRT